MTVDDLAAELGRTANAVRSQLIAMERDGLVRRTGQRPGTTRPSHVFELTSEVEHLLSRAPSKNEAAACMEFLKTQVELYRKTNPKELQSVGGPSPDPSIRARESLVRVLYNHNDFVIIH